MEKNDIVETLIENILCNIDGIQKEDIDLNVSLAELGADSIDIVEIISSSMRSLKIKASRTSLLGCKTVIDIANKLSELGNSKAIDVSNGELQANDKSITQRDTEEGVL